MKHKILTLMFVALGWHNQVFSQIFVTSTQTWSAAVFDATAPLFGTWNSGANTLTLTSSVIIHHATNDISLTIDGIIVEFADQTQLAVQHGEELNVINDAILQASNEYWAGISGVGSTDIDGNPDEDQFLSGIPEKFEAFTGNEVYNPDQTMIFLENAHIIDAEVGVFSQHGAIVRITGSSFTNCKVGVLIRDYEHEKVGTKNMENRNACFLDNSTFTVDSYQDFSSPDPVTDFSQYRMVHLQRVYGVHIQGCTFTNANSDSWDCDRRGKGILAEDATFTVHESGVPTVDPDSCVTYDGQENAFAGFSKGIHCLETGTQTRRTNSSISKCTFTFCEISIHAEDNHRLLITHSTVDMGDLDLYADNSNSCNNGYQGILLELVEEYVVQECELECTPLSNYPQDITMIQVINGGTRNSKIFKNIFTNTSPDALNSTVVTGVLLEGINSEIDIWCNSFTEIRFGITVASGSVINQMWLKDFPVLSPRSVNNLFSGTIDRTLDLNNLSANNITYYERSSVFDPLKKSTRWIPSYETIEPDCDPLSCKEAKWPIGVGISEVSDLNITVFPNPVNSEQTIFLSLELPASGTIRIYDLLGKQELSHDFNETTDIQLHNHNLKSGIHFIVLEYSSGEKASYKLVVQE